MNESASYTADLFVSFAEADRAWVEGYLLEALQSAGLRVLSEATFTIGVPRLLEFERSIGTSRRTLLVLSAAYLADDVSRFIELLVHTHGLEHGQWPVIPLRLEAIELPDRLTMLTSLDATDPANHQAVVKQLCELLDRQAPPPSVAPTCPYPGLRSFDETQHDRFFGREAEIQALLHRLRHHPFLTVIGPSGSGKSSLVFAGLVPTLRQSGLFGPGEWLVRHLRPGRAPAIELARALAVSPIMAADGAPPVTASGLASGPGLSPDAATQVANLLATKPAARRLLLIIDQFEEVYTLAPAAAVAFQERLRELTAVPNTWVVVTVRADFYPELMSSPLWAAMQAHRVEITPLDDDGLRQAIIRPAAGVGVVVEPTLTERLVQDAAGEPGALPLVQETLVLLWEHLERRLLPLRAYEQLVQRFEEHHDQTSLNASHTNGRHRTALQVALTAHADQTLAALEPALQPLARRILVRLVQFGEGRANTRRQQTVAELTASDDDPDRLAATIEHLAVHRLLTVSADTTGAGRRVDIAHEALIVGWPQLGRWISERRASEQSRRRLVAKADDWVRLGRGSGGLLDAVELQEAERWLANEARDMGDDADLLALVALSRSTLAAAAVEVEAAHRREVEQAQALAAEQRSRADEKTRTAARLRVLVAGLAVVLVGALVAGTLAVQQWQTSQRLRRGPIALGLAAQAPRQQTEQGEPERAALLAFQAYQFARQSTETISSEIDTGLRSVLEEPFRGLVLRARQPGARLVAASRDGQLLVVAGEKGALWVRQIGDWQASRRELGAVEGAELVGSPIVTGHGRGGDWAVLAKDSQGHIWRWSTNQSDGTPSRLITVTSKETISASADGRWLASRDESGLIRLWDLNQAVPSPVVMASSRPENPVGSRSAAAMAFEEHGGWLVAYEGNRRLKLWDPTRPEIAQRVLEAPPVALDTLAFSPNGQYLAASDRDGWVWLWQNLEVGTAPLRLLGGGQTVRSIRFAEDGRWLAAGGDDWMVRLWDLQRQVDEPARLSGHLRAVQTVAFTSDSKSLVSVSNDETARLWQLEQPSGLGLVLTGASTTSGRTYSLAFSADGRLASGNDDGRLRIWSADRPGQPPLVLVGDPNARRPSRIWSVAFSPDGRRLVTGDDEGVVRLWPADRLGEAAIRPIERRVSFPVRSVAVSADGRWLAAGGGGEQSTGQDNPVAIWSLNEAATTPSLLLRGHSAIVESVAFNPTDPGLLAWASQDRTVRLVRLTASGTVQEIAVMAGLEAGPRVLAFDPSGQRLASGSGQSAQAGAQPGIVHLWELERGDRRPTERRPLKALGGGVHALAFNPRNGSLLATGSVDGTVRLWDINQPDAPVAILNGHERLVRAVAIRADGKTIASGGATDNMIRLWLTTDGLADLVCRGVQRNLSLDEWHQFVGRDIPYAQTCSNLPPGAGAPGAGTD